MNFGIPLWAKALVLVVLLVGSFGAGMVTESRWEIKAQNDLVLKQQEAARVEREALASALTQKMEVMRDAAIESANTRSTRERELEKSNSQLIQEAEDNVKGNGTVLSAGSATALDRLRRNAPANAGKPK